MSNMRYPQWFDMRTQKIKGSLTSEGTEEDTDHLLPHHNKDKENEIDFNSQEKPHDSLFTRVVVNLLVVLVALAVMIIFLLFQIYMQDSKCYGKFENGFDTDLGKLRLFNVQVPSPS